MDDFSGGPAAIVSRMVASRQRPILYGHRDESLEDDDSGWQFTAGGHDDMDEGGIAIWSIDEVIELEPSILPFLNLPPGTQIARRTETQAWRVL